MKISKKSPCRILVVDDEARACRAIRLALVRNGCRVSTTGTGERALARLKHDRFDVVIVDRAMVGFKGNELAARVKQKWPRLPIIMTSDFATEFNLSGTKFKNVDYVLAKSYAPTELLEAVACVQPRKIGRPVPPRSLSDWRTTLN